MRPRSSLAIGLAALLAACAGEGGEPHIGSNNPVDGPTGAGGGLGAGASGAGAHASGAPGAHGGDGPKGNGAAGNGVVGEGAGGSAGGGGIGGDGGGTPAGGSSNAGQSPSVALGAFFTCAVTTGDTVRCWGDNGQGQLGYGDTKTRGDTGGKLSVGDVSVGAPVAHVATGQHHTCVLTKLGTVRCWGANTHGQLGYGDTKPRGDSGGTLSVSDVAVGGTVVQIAAGAEHTCAVLAGGALRCWGMNELGQLGYGDTIPRGTAGGVLSVSDIAVGGPVAQVVAGLTHTCALLTDGKVRCWGWNQYGQLGYGDQQTRGDKGGTLSVGDVNLGARAVQIAAGLAHNCAVLETGNVRCWGYNNYGQLGYGDVDHHGSTGGKLSVGDVTVGAKVLQIATPALHTCALLVGGKVRCWGNNDQGQLGYGDTLSRGGTGAKLEVPDVDVGAEAKLLAYGPLGDHTCVIVVGGTVRCWGTNGAGGLGYGDLVTRGDNPGELPTPDVDIGAPVPLRKPGRACVAAALRDSPSCAMSKTPLERAPLVSAAVSLEDELSRYEKLSAEVARMTIGSEKTLARAARAVTEAAECQQRIFERIGALSEAMEQTRARQEAAVIKMAEAARHVGERASLFQTLIARFGALSEVARSLSTHAGEIGTRSADGAEPAEMLQLIGTLVEGMGGAVTVADALMKTARENEFEEIARDAESLKRQMAASRHRLSQAQRSIAEKAPSLGAGERPFVE